MKVKPNVQFLRCAASLIIQRTTVRLILRDLRRLELENLA